MADVLVVAEFGEGKLKRTTHSAITFAKQAADLLGGGYDVLLMGHGLDAAAAELAKLGPRKVMVADNASLEHYLAEIYAPTVATAAAAYAVVCGPASAFGKDLLPRVAGRLDAGYAADITELVGAEGGKLECKRPMFAGNAFGVCVIDSAVQVISVRQSAFDPTAPTEGGAPIAAVEVAPAGQGAERIEWVSYDQVANERPELAEADVVISGGRALKNRFHEVLDPLADIFTAAIGATRAACDAGYCAPDLQVGQTGKIVAPGVYFAIGLSGAIQHLAGMKSSKVIVAINKDPDAPIFTVADYGLVADLFQAVPELVEALKVAKAG